MGLFGMPGRHGPGILALLTTVFVAPVAAAPAPPSSMERVAPALWVVRDADTTIYLFGTFHALDGRANWFDRSVRAAFDGSDSLVLETLIPDRPVLPPGPPPQGPRQAMDAGSKVGMRADQGADAVLRRAAIAARKPVEGLESFDFQIAMYQRISPPTPAATSAAPVSASAANGQAELTAFMVSLQQAWVAGDASKFEAVVEAVNAGSPSTYRILFADRNAAWAKWIGKRLDRPGTVFVAVGTGHLVGRDSVQAKLARRGIASTRIG